MIDIREHGGNYSGGGGSNIKSSQRGSVDFYADRTGNYYKDITIDAIDTNKSIVRVEFIPLNVNRELVEAEILNETTIRLRTRSAPTLNPFIVNWEVLEFENVKSLQRGASGIYSTNSTVDISISPVDTLKSLVLLSISSNRSVNTANLILGFVRSNLQETMLTVTRQPADNTYIQWQVIEFK